MSWTRLTVDRARQDWRAVALALAVLTSAAAGPVAAAETIEPRSGRLALSATDLVVPAGPVLIDLTRVLALEAGGRQLLGARWRLTWEVRLERQADGMVLSDGLNRTVFRRQGTSAHYLGPAGERLTLAADGRAELSRADATTDSFDAQGRLSGRALRNGNRITLRYAGTGRLTRIEGPRRAFVDLVGDAQGRVVRATASDGREARYTYAGENLIAVEGSDGLTTRYAYDAKGALTRIEDARSGPVELGYDDQGRVTARRRADGSREHFEYVDARGSVRRTDATGAMTTWQTSADGRREEITDPAGGTTVVDSDDAGHPLAIRAPSGLTVRFQYDDRGRLTQVTSPAGTATRYDYLGDTGLLAGMTYPDGTRQVVEYDKERNPVAVRLGGERLAAYTYTPDGLVSSATERDGSRTTYGYDADGRIVSVTDALGRVTRYEYDRHGNPVRETDPAGGVIRRSYDQRDRLLGETDANGSTTRFEYGTAGRLVRLIHPGGSEERYEYDARGRLVATIGPDGRRAAEELDAAGRVLMRRRADGFVEQFWYDAQGLVTQSTDALGRTSRFDYDGRGRLVGERHPTGRTLRYGYDSFGRIVSVDDAHGGVSRNAWDANGLLAAITDATGATVRFAYDPFGRVAAVTDPLGRERRFTYDRGGRLVATTSPGGDVARTDHDAAGQAVAIHLPDGSVTRIAHDALGNVTGIDGPRGPVVRHRYDQAGERIATTDASGRTTTFTYDPRGRLTRKGLPDGRTISYRHGAADELLEVTDGTFPIEYRYDQQGRLTATTYRAMARSIAYAYDAAGLLEKVTGSAGQEIAYRYDGVRRLTAIGLPGGGEIAIGYDAAGRLQSVQYPNGIRGQWRYTPTGAVESLGYVNAANEVVASWRYGYDAAGNPVKIERAGRPPLAYRYDADGRLTEEASGTGPAVRYAYRPGGDRSTRSAGGATTTYQYDRQLLASAGAERLAYDGEGNLARRTGASASTTYGFDAQNQLVRATPSGGAAVSFGYAANGQRAWRRDGAGLTWFLYDGDNLLEEIDEAGASAALYVHGPGLDRPLAMLRDGQRYFYLADALGSIAAVTDGRGQVVARYDTDAFGDLLSPLPALRNPFVFTGREYEPGLRLYYYRARYYDPALGRFLSPDALPGQAQDPATLNPYVYARNAPTRFRDPLGLHVGAYRLTWSAPRDYRIDYDYWSSRYGVSRSAIQQMERDLYRAIRTDPGKVPAYGGNPPSALQLRSDVRYMVERTLNSARWDDNPAAMVESAQARLAGPQTAPRSWAATGLQSPKPSNIVSLSEIFPEGPSAGTSAGNVANGAAAGPAVSPSGGSLSGNTAGMVVRGGGAGSTVAGETTLAVAPPMPRVDATQAVPRPPVAPTPEAGGLPRPPTPPAAGPPPTPSAPGGAAAEGAAGAGPAAAGPAPTPLYTGALTAAAFGGGASAGLCALNGGTLEECAESGAAGATIAGAAQVLVNGIRAATAAVAGAGSTAAGAVAFVTTRILPPVGAAALTYQVVKAIKGGPRGEAAMQQAEAEQARSEDQARAMLGTEEGVDTIIRSAVERIRKLQALRDRIDGELKTFDANRVKAEAETANIQALVKLPGEGVTISGPRVLWSGDYRGLGVYCVEATGLLGKLDGQAADMTKEAKRIVVEINTAAVPPESTPAMRKVAGDIATVRGKIGQATQAATDLTKTLPGLEEGFRGLAAGRTQLDAGEKRDAAQVDAYAKALDALQKQVGDIAAEGKDFDKQKDDIRGYLERMKALAQPRFSGYFDDTRDDVAAIVLPSGMETTLAKPGPMLFASNKLVSDARSSVKLAYGQVRDRLKDESDKCSVLGGLDASGVALHARNALQEAADALRAIPRAVDARKRQLAKRIEIGNDTIETVKRRLPEAEQKQDAAAKKRLEELRAKTQELVKSTRDEAEVLMKAEPAVAGVQQGGEALESLGRRLGGR